MPWSRRFLRKDIPSPRPSWSYPSICRPRRFSGRPVALNKNNRTNHAIPCTGGSSIPCAGVLYDAVSAYAHNGSLSLRSAIDSFFINVIQRHIMPMANKFLHSAANRVFERPVRISSLAISPSAEDLSFLARKFKEADWKLYTASTYRDALVALGLHRMPVVLCECQ